MASGVVKNFFGMPAIEMASNTSIDTLTNNVLRVYFSNQWTGSPSPDTYNGTVVVIPRSGNNLYQIYFSPAIDYGIFLRARVSNGTYSAWKRVSLT